MSGLNRVIIMGHLGQDPEVKMTQGGRQVGTLSIATSEEWKDQAGNKQSRTEWHKIVVWDKLAELASKHLKKGRRTLVEGKLQTREWTDQNGQKRYTTEIVANNIVFADSAGGQGGNPGPSDAHAPRSSAPAPQDYDTSDVPF